MYFQLASGKTIEALPTGSYAVDDKRYYIEAIRGIGPEPLSIVRTEGGLYRLVLKLPSNVNSLDFSYSIIW